MAKTKVKFIRTDGLSVGFGNTRQVPTLRTPIPFTVAPGQARHIRLGVACEGHPVLIYPPAGLRQRGILLEGRKVFDPNEEIYVLLKSDSEAPVTFEEGEAVVRAVPLLTSEFSVES